MTQATLLIGQLRATGCTLIYDPQQRTLRSSSDYGAVVIRGRSH